MRKLLAFLLMISLCLSLTACGGTEAGTVSEAPEAPKASSSVTAETLAALSGSGEASISLKDGASGFSGSGVSIDGDTITITAEGSYTFTGSLTDGQILIDAEDCNVAMNLNNASISSKSSAALYVIRAKNVYLSTEENTVNRLSTEGEFVQTDGNSVDAAIFFKADLFLTGSGELQVNCAYGHGIVSKDDLEISSGTYAVSASSKGIYGKDSVEIFSGTISIQAGTDGIASENTEDTEKGTITIAGGSISMDCGRDGIDASGKILIEDGSFAISTSGSDRNESYKGIKSNADITINGGTFQIDSSDDSLHAGGSVCINGGGLVLSSGDDGIHADAGLTVTGGSIDIQKSYEGLEALNIEISGGEIRVISSDDGFNAAGGSDSSERFGMFSRDSFSSSEGASLTISGGTIRINAEGDGLDSNGSLLISGGATYVSGPTNSGNGALDYGSSGSVTGGTVIAVGMAGMEQNFDSSSTQGTILYTCSSVQPAGSEIKLTDSKGNVLASYAPEKNYQTVIISAPGISGDGVYMLTAGTESAQIEMDGLIYGSGGFGAMGGMHGGTGKGNRGQMPEGDTGTFPGGMPEGEKGGLPSDMPGGDRGSFGGRA